MRDQPSWRKFHRKKRLARKLFLKWQVNAIQEFKNSKMELGQCDICGKDAHRSDWRGVLVTVIYSYGDYGSIEGFDCWCSRCLYESIHAYDDAYLCFHCDEGLIYNPIVIKRTGKRKYDSCPHCGNGLEAT